MRASAQIVGWMFPDQRARLRLLARPHLAAASLFVSTLIVIGLVTGRTNDRALHWGALPSESARNPALRVHVGRIEREQEFVVVQGEAVNLTSRELRNAEAVLELFDARGRLCQVESALLEVPDLRPGEESPFRIQTHFTDAATTYRVRFRRLLGDALPSISVPR